MEPPDFTAVNLNLTLDAPPSHPLCERWDDTAEDAVFHLSNVLLVLGFMGGSGLYGLLYTFTLLTLGFFCASVRAWAAAAQPCGSSGGADGLLWSAALLAVCVAQLAHATHRLRGVTFGRDHRELYERVFRGLGVTPAHFAEILRACSDGGGRGGGSGGGGEPRVVERDHCFAVEGKTAIDKLSVLISGRMVVTVNGEFLHYIYPYQFLDSPEWDSLRPSEEGLFQVTLRADRRCRYVAWRRKKLYLLFAKHRYIAKVFALVVRNDIAEKLFSLNDKAVDGSGRRYDLRLPSYCHAASQPDLDQPHAATLQVGGGGGGVSSSQVVAYSRGKQV